MAARVGEDRIGVVGAGRRCAWCGAAGVPFGSRIVRCSACGAGTTFPVPDDAELDLAYATYRPQEGRFGPFGDRLLRKTRGSLAGRIDRRAPPGPVLDVGAGDGNLLDALRARGREAVGLERESRREDVVVADLPSFTDRRGEWAAVVLWHSLEHLREPGLALDRACSLLRPGGLLIVATPNWGSWQARVFGERWLALDLPRHLVHLPAQTLVARLAENGMQIERLSFWRGGQVLFGWLHGLVARLPGELDLYGAVRIAAARERPMSARRRAVALGSGATLFVPAVLLSCLEILARAGGSVMIEARRRSNGPCS